MIVRRAMAAEAGTLTVIAYAAKRHWGYPESWIARWSDVLTITPDFIRSHPVHVALHGDAIAGFHTILVEGERASLEHLWVLPEHMGQGVGSRLFRHALDTAVALGARTLTIESDPYAEAFYMHMGARRTGARDASVDGTPRVLPILEIALVK